MAFQIKSEDQTFKAVVKIEQISEDGKRKIESFKAQFRMMSYSEFKEISELLENGEITDRDFVNKVMVGWEDVKGLDGRELEFTEENKEAAFQVVPVLACIVSTYYNSLPTAKLKN